MSGLLFLGGGGGDEGNQRMNVNSNATKTSQDRKAANRKKRITSIGWDDQDSAGMHSTMLSVLMLESQKSGKS